MELEYAQSCPDTGSSCSRAGEEALLLIKISLGSIWSLCLHCDCCHVTVEPMDGHMSWAPLQKGLITPANNPALGGCPHWWKKRKRKQIRIFSRTWDGDGVEKRKAQSSRTRVQQTSLGRSQASAKPCQCHARPVPSQSVHGQCPAAWGVPSLLQPKSSAQSCLRPPFQNSTAFFFNLILSFLIFVSSETNIFSLDCLELGGVARLSPGWPPAKLWANTPHMDQLPSQWSSRTEPPPGQMSTSAVASPCNPKWHNETGTVCNCSNDTGELFG